MKKSSTRVRRSLCLAVFLSAAAWAAGQSGQSSDAAARADWPAYSTSWIGNDLPCSDGLYAHGSSSQDRREQGSFPQAAHGLAVRADGLCAVSSRWGEVGITGGLAQGGDWIATFNAWGAPGDGSSAAVVLDSVRLESLP